MLSALIGGFAAVAVLIGIAAVMSKKPDAPPEAKVPPAEAPPKAPPKEPQPSGEAFTMPPAAIAVPSKAPQAPHNDEPAKMTNRDYQAGLDLQIYRLNTAGLVAAILDSRGLTTESGPLRASMDSFEETLKDMVATLKSQGHDPFVPDYFQSGDRIMFLDAHDLSKKSPEEADKVMTEFVASLHAGVRCQIIVKRGKEPLEFRAVWHQRPKELSAILQLASIIPAGKTEAPTDPAVTEKQPVDPPKTAAGPLETLANPADRGVAAKRAQAMTDLAQLSKASKAGGLFEAASIYLSREDADWKIGGVSAAILQGWFDAVKIVEAEKYDAARWTSSLADLAKRIADVKSKEPAAIEPFQVFAAGVAADAEKNGVPTAEVQRLVSGTGISRTAEGKKWGDPLSVLCIDLGYEAIHGKLNGTAGRYASTHKPHPQFMVRYLGIFQWTLETFEDNAGGYDRLCAAFRSLAKDSPAAGAAHLDALGDRLESFAKCVTCQNGKVVCPKCGGDGKFDMKCDKCAGSGKFEKGGGTQMCNKCSGTGAFKNIECGCGKSANKVDCSNCKGRVWYSKLEGSPLELLIQLKPCKGCKQTGSVASRIARVCTKCFGVGRIVHPVSDLTKTPAGN